MSMALSRRLPSPWCPEGVHALAWPSMITDIRSDAIAPQSHYHVTMLSIVAAQRESNHRRSCLSAGAKLWSLKRDGVVHFTFGPRLSYVCLQSVWSTCHFSLSACPRLRSPAFLHCRARASGHPGTRPVWTERLMKRCNSDERVSPQQDWTSESGTS